MANNFQQETQIAMWLVENCLGFKVLLEFVAKLILQFFGNYLYFKQLVFCFSICVKQEGVL